MRLLRWFCTFLILAIAALFPFGGPASASAENSEITVTIDGRPIYFDVLPQNMNGRVMVPLRAIFESLGAEVDWDATTQTITGTKGDTIVTLVVNNPTATVNGKEIVLDVPPVIINGRTLVPVRFVSESLGAKVEWDGNRQQVIIATGKEIGELDIYFFVYNSERVDASDLNAIRRYVSNFHDTYNVLFDAAGYQTAADLYDALRVEKDRIGQGDVAGIQIFGTSSDVPAFPYVHKMKVMEPNANGWNGIEHNKNEKYATDFFYSTFQNDSKYLREDITVYGIVQEKKPITIVPEWPVTRLPLTKGEIAGYIAKYEDYRKQIEDKRIPTVVLAAPTNFQDGLAQNDVAHFLERLKKEEQFGNLFKNSDLRAFKKDLSAKALAENKNGIMDLVIGANGTKDGAKQEGSVFFGQDTVSGMSANYYTSLFWTWGEAASNLDGDSIVRHGLVNGKMINPIASTTGSSNGGIENFIWGRTEEGFMDYLPVSPEMLAEKTNPLYFLWKYYANLEEGKSRLESFHNAKVEFAKLTESNQADLQATFGFELVIGLHYLGLADY